MKKQISFLSTILLLLGATAVNAQTSEKAPCSQPSSVRSDLAVQAERESFNIRHREIVGNTRRSGRDFFKRIGPMLDEGDIFKIENLTRALRTLSKMKSISPLSLENVQIRLDPDDRAVDIAICITERHSNR